MAGFASVAQAMVAVESLLKRTIPADLGSVALLPSGEIKKPASNRLGLWVHRITVDLNGRNRFLSSPPGSGLPPRPELPLNVHFLMMSWATSGDFSAEQINENASALLQTLSKMKPATSKGIYFKSISMASTMSPGINVDYKTVAGL